MAPIIQQQEQPDSKLKIFWFPSSKAKPKKKSDDGKYLNESTMKICQQVSKDPAFENFREMEIRCHMHTALKDMRKHITARLKTAEQKESKHHQVVHVYSAESFQIFPEVKYD